MKKKMRVLPDFEQAKRLSAVRVLLVEDDGAFAELVRALLREVRWAELSLEHAATLAEATARLSAERFDLIISDLNLPDSRGLNTVEALARSSDRLIIVLTGERDDGLRESAITLGAYDLVNKDSLRHAELDRLVRLAWMQSSTFRSLRQSEEDLRAAEVDHRLLFEHAVEGMYRVDGAGRVVAANPALAAILGYGTTAEMMRGIGDVAREVYVDRADRSRYRKRLAAEGLVSNFETRWRRRDGSVIWVSLSGRLVRDAATGAGFHLGSAKDITERKQAELALRGSEEQLRIAADKLHRFRLALDNSGDIVVLIDREAMRFVDVNST
ncbi:MAG TPA: PAS domain S-box protein, partial [Burkholderiales bacterium]|nr:PAS domain S-box protein [Burkholderiales bacterium]